MPSESELRDTLRGEAANDSPRIDAGEVIRKAKARRAPRQIAFGSVMTLAVVGFTVLGLGSVPSLFSTSQGSADSAMVPGAESQTNESGADSTGGVQGLGDARPGENDALTSQCGAPALAVAPNSLSLELTVSFPDSAPANGQPVTGTVTLTNTGPSPTRGLTDVEPFLELTRDGITVWHSNGAMPSSGRVVDLARGESMSYSASFTPVECSSDDEEGVKFPDTLPELGAGDVTLTAIIQYFPDSAAGKSVVVVSGPSETITLR